MLSARHDPCARMLNVDLIAVLVAVLLPWSTSGVGIGMVLWLAALATTLELRPFLRSLQRPICALPIALVALAALGTLWSDASWGARLHAVEPRDEAARAAVPVLSFRALDARHVGIRRVPGVLHADDGRVLDRRDRSQPFAEGSRRADRARHLRQELHRPEPGIRVVRGRAGFPHHHAAAGRENPAWRCC